MRNQYFVRTIKSASRVRLGLSTLILAAFLAACSASTPAPTPTSAFTPTTAMTDTPAVTATATVLDPCQLIGSQEASTFTGGSFGQGTEQTNSNSSRMCIYGANTDNVFEVEVAQAKTVDEAQAYKTDFLNTIQANAAQLSSKGLQVTQLPNFADGAVLAQGSFTLPTGTVNGSAIGVLRGTIFFGFSDIVIGRPAPTAEALQTEATAVMARLP